MTYLSRISLFALLTVVLAAPAAHASEDPIAFAGPVRSGQAEGVSVVLSGFSVRAQASPEASEAAKAVIADKRGKVVCRMVRGNVSRTRKSSHPVRRNNNSARWNFSRPLMTVGEGGCRLVDSNGDTVVKVPFTPLTVVE